MLRFLLPLTLVALFLTDSPAQDQPYTRTEDVIYGRKHGVALTLDVFTPNKDPNGLGVVFCVSGGWFSSKEAINLGFIKPLLARGYTVFAVVHGSQPRFTLPEIIDDLHRSVRFIRANAEKYKVDAERLGICGGSAGGHLSLMMGNAFRPGDDKARDPVEKQPSKVAAVACFFPPTDFLNWGKDNFVMLGEGDMKAFRAPFDFRERNPVTNSWYTIPDEEKRQKIGKECSPIYHVKKGSAPALIIHGDADKLVPIQQAERIAAAYKKADVPFDLIVKKGAAHGWAGIDKDIGLFADWFDTHLKPTK
jgi:acetyl esterase/lipase